jgi:glycine/D-amino acid oxidase-like deaminating enzyme
MSHSYWENNTFFNQIDFAIIGSGIVGLSTAIHLRLAHPNAKIVILEKGYLPAGASSKNAGFACFGSPSEILNDLQNNTEEEVYNLVEMRKQGLESLQNICGSATIDFQQNGSYEVFGDTEQHLYAECSNRMNALNKILYPIFKSDVYSHKDDCISTFGFNNVNHLIYNQFEGQIDTGKMIHSYLSVARKMGIEFFNGIEITQLIENEDSVTLVTSDKTEIKSSSVFVATNGFASSLLPELDVKPARAQVLITKPIENLAIKGTFHMLEGYYYFRNIHNRILFGGGRNLDITGETTSQLATTDLIQNQLNQYLKDIILPDTNFEIEQSWSGIMGVGASKKPIVKSVGARIHCGVKMGGMGVAIGTSIGKKLSELHLK